MKIEDLKRGTQIWVRGYADGMGNISFLDSERNIDELDYLDSYEIATMDESDFRLDEPDLDQPKTVVPQMIFDVIQSFDEDVNYLHEHMSYQSDEVREWLTHNEREFYEAYLAYPNIEVEKEKLYTVEIPDPNYNESVVILSRNLSGYISIAIANNKGWRDRKANQLTESEIRKDFEWAWREEFMKEVE